MAKKTFHKLNPAKKEKIMEAFLREFSLKKFDEASLSAVVKSLGIAKGSVYQYFGSKFDLFLYLFDESVKIKMKYIQDIRREDYPDFWNYFRELYNHGVQFDLEHPMASHFLHNYAKNIDSPSLKKYNEKLRNQTLAGLGAMIQHEVDIGDFRKDISVQTMAFFLYKMSRSIFDYLEEVDGINIEKSIQKGTPVFAGKNKKKLMQAVDDHILLIKKSFEK